jgi:hypothetical protein
MFRLHWCGVLCTFNVHTLHVYTKMCNRQTARLSYNKLKEVKIVFQVNKKNDTQQTNGGV